MQVETAKNAMEINANKCICTPPRQNGAYDTPLSMDCHDKSKLKAMQMQKNEEKKTSPSPAPPVVGPLTKGGSSGPPTHGRNGERPPASQQGAPHMPVLLGLCSNVRRFFTTTLLPPTELRTCVPVSSPAGLAQGGRRGGRTLSVGGDSSVAGHAGPRFGAPPAPACAPHSPRSSAWACRTRWPSSSLPTPALHR